MKFLFLGLLALSLLFCSWIFGRPSLKPSEKVFLAAARAVEKKYGLKLVGEGGAQKNGKKREVPYCFEMRCAPITVDKVRRLIVPMSEDLLNGINAHPEIANELVQFPFTLKNLTFSIVFASLDNKDVFAPYVWSTNYVLEAIYYNIKVDVPSQPGLESRLKQNQREPFAEAKHILATEALDRTPH